MRRIAVVLCPAFFALAHCGAIAPESSTPPACTDADVPADGMTALDAAGDRLVWGTRTGSVMVHGPSGDTELGRTDGSIRAIAQTATQVLVATDRAVIAFDRATGAPSSPFGDTGAPKELAAVGERVCLLDRSPDGRGVLRCLGGGPSIEVALVSPHALAMNTNHAFVSTSTADGERTMRVALSDGATLPVARGARWALAADDASVYVAFDGGMGAAEIAGLYAFSVSGTELDSSTEPFARDPGTMNGLALGGGAAWISTEQMLWRHPKAGGTPIATAAGDGHAWGSLATSSTALYRTHLVMGQYSPIGATIEKRCFALH